MQSVRDLFQQRIDTQRTPEEDDPPPPSTPRKKKQLNEKSPTRTLSPQSDTNVEAALEEVKQSTATNFVACMRYYHADTSAEVRAQEVCRIINGTMAIKKSVVTRAAPIMKAGKHTGLAAVTIDTDLADDVPLAALERIVILADQSLKHVSDFIGLPEDCDFSLLLSTISHYMTVHETELRNKDKEGFEKNPFEWEMRYVPNGDSYHKDVPYLRDASPAKGKAFAMAGVATNAGSLIDVIKASKIEQHGDFLYIDDDEKACMSDELLTKVSKGMNKTLKTRKIQPSGKVNGGIPPQVDGMPTWKSESTELLRDPITFFVESEFGRDDFKFSIPGAIGMSIIRHIFTGVVDCWANNKDIAHPRVLRVMVKVSAPHGEEARMKVKELESFSAQAKKPEDAVVKYRIKNEYEIDYTYAVKYSANQATAVARAGGNAADTGVIADLKQEVGSKVAELTAALKEVSSAQAKDHEEAAKYQREHSQEVKEAQKKTEVALQESQQAQKKTEEALQTTAAKIDEMATKVTTAAESAAAAHIAAEKNSEESKANSEISKELLVKMGMLFTANFEAQSATRKLEGASVHLIEGGGGGSSAAAQDGLRAMITLAEWDLIPRELAAGAAAALSRAKAMGAFIPTSHTALRATPRTFPRCTLSLVQYYSMPMPPTLSLTQSHLPTLWSPQTMTWTSPEHQSARVQMRS